MVLGTVWIGSDRPVEVRVATVTERAGDPGSATVLNASGYVTARRQATAQGRALAEELSVLVIHGLFHILGHDHEDEEEAARMTAAEEPYRRRLRRRFASKPERS